MSVGQHVVATAEAAVEITGLGVELPGREPVRIVDGVDLRIGRGEWLALVGESGSGKSVTARAIMQLDDAMQVTGSVRLAGEELVGAGERALRRVRGSRISMVFQDPLRALNPVMTIGAQVSEPLVLRGTSVREARRRAVEVLDELGVPSARERMGAYPFEFSGGMRQRVALAIALIADPEVLIADEPTTALDTRVQERVLEAMDRAARERGTSVLLITHDLGIVAGYADRVAVMYAGRKVEEGYVDEIYRAPRHPYTQGLLAAVPRVDRPAAVLAAMPGSPPAPARRPPGCAFSDRCPIAVERCSEERPELRRVVGGSLVACHRVEERIEAWA